MPDPDRTDPIWQHYPKGWPACVFCGRPVLTDHFTCGRVECSESAARDQEAEAWRRGQQSDNQGV